MTTRTRWPIAVTIAAAVCLPLLLLAATAEAPTAKPESVGFSEERLQRVHDVINRYIDAHQITGAVTLVARKGRVVRLEAQGLMDVESKKPMARDSIFRVWSMSKPVAGVAIMMLLEEGKVRLNDPVSAFIPEFKTIKAAPEGWAGPVAATREITVQDLLTHVSGLGSGPLTKPDLDRLRPKEGDSLATNIPRLATTNLAFQPGTRWAYSPLMGFDTLGRIVEVASGQSFDQFLRARLFEPLGMKETFFYPGEARWPRLVTAYHRADGVLKKTEDPNWLISKTYFSGAGGLLSTAEDYSKFALMLAQGGQFNSKRILSPKTIELMSSVFAPDTLPGRQPGRGFGLSVQVISDPVAAGQRVSAGSFGWDGAYGTHFWVDPKEKVVGILMIQTDNPNRQLDRDFENAVMQAIVE